MKDAHPTLTRIRAQIYALAEQIGILRQGALPKVGALAAVDRHIQSMAASVRVKPSAFAQGGGEPVSMYPEDSHRYACKFFPEVIRAHLYAEVKALYERGLTVADDATREKLEAQQLQLEHEEEAYIRQAAAEGKSIPRRGEANPAVLLADWPEGRDQQAVSRRAPGVRASVLRIRDLALVTGDQVQAPY
ncbi:hypothetical protein [Stenotrophomonas sp. CFBP8994]|uniref:hypothetical protein n=1 Tax=Stenotrophomonas sp. CFBP8994 TaxID=3096527 RepID=UPI002A6ABC4D|nr:hypothetical protein [Stenotrophomonas sp. CFBP8994]MDY0981320.1 hypothetical protein [Stenotrophomonas sp. CFBP8994]